MEELADHPWISRDIFGREASTQDPKPVQVVVK
jgi:hypothetical protein